ncbi:MAG: hypothetical protein AMR96_07110 [Candidatus Adiutrix intracellularis]|nr:MAG: hypothetical protein AMR96_07110 [Candidatus Adiutrix intracellularis]MDR2827703.1 HAD family phosphatase [Candidatus Adiutrix intracellularis]
MIFEEYQAAIFDLDGTLTDSMPVWERLGRDWLLKKGLSPPANLERDIELMTLPQSARYIIIRLALNLTIEQVLLEWEELVRRSYEETVLLKDGAVECIRFLAERGLKLAIVTSSFPAACEAVLRRYGLREYFAQIVYLSEVNWDKTNPDIWRLCAGRLGLLPETCLVFEDLRAAGLGVRAAGMGLAAVYDPSGAVEWEILKNEADLVVQTWRDLLIQLV